MDKVAVFRGSWIDGLQIDGSHDEHIQLLIGDAYKYCVSVAIYLIYNYFNNNDKTLHILGTLTSLLKFPHTSRFTAGFNYVITVTTEGKAAIFVYLLGNVFVNNYNDW